MSTAQTLLLGSIAGLTIFLGLPMGRMRGLSPKLKAFFTATATGILLFLFWDVLSEAIDPVQGALQAKTWGRFAGVSSIALAGFVAGLMSLVYYDTWMKKRQRKAMLGPGAASVAEFSRTHKPGLSAAQWLSVVIAIGHSWTGENLSILFFALAAGSIFYVVAELLNVCRTFGSKALTAWGVVLGLTLGFATDFILVAAGV